MSVLSEKENNTSPKTSSHLNLLDVNSLNIYTCSMQFIAELNCLSDKPIDQVDLLDGIFKYRRYQNKVTTHLVKSPSNIDLFLVTNRHYKNDS